MASSICNAALRGATPSLLGFRSGKAHLHLVKRPKHLDPPDYLSKSPPVPKPKPLIPAKPPAGDEEKPDPTRYGDWEKKGIAIDF
jgi:hypothetical protein